MIKNLFEQIRDAQEIAIEKGIRTNSVILNDKYDYCKEFIVTFSTFDLNNKIIQIPPMILGKEIIVAPLPDEYTFALTELKKKEDYFSLIQEALDIHTKYYNKRGCMKREDKKRLEELYEKIRSYN